MSSIYDDNQVKAEQDELQWFSLAETLHPAEKLYYLTQKKDAEFVNLFHDSLAALKMPPPGFIGYDSPDFPFDGDFSTVKVGGCPF